MAILQALVYGLILWLGLYLLARDLTNQILRWTAAGLLLYALLLAWMMVTESVWAWLLIALSLIMLLVDIRLARSNVLALGEAFWPDFFRSLDGALLFSLLFGAPVALTLFFAPEAGLPLRLLLLINITFAVITQVFAGPIQSTLDRVAFPTQPQLRQERANLREAAEVLPKVDETATTSGLDEAEFTKLTRRALGHLGDLPKLAASPLARLPLIDARLVARQAPDNTLERAAELKRLLTEAICYLKPPGAGDFETSDAWRHYNALYFPYVLGLKPYSRRADQDVLDKTSRQALEWFRSQVPERTLYNWQNAGAKLVAQYLREVEK